MAFRRKLSHKERKELYAKYLKTEHWQARRKVALEDAGYQCEDCGRKEDATFRLEVHHLTYARIFRERKEDLRALCPRCHGKRHGYLGVEDMQDFNTHKTGGRILHLIDSAMQDIAAKNEAERLAERTPRIGASRLGENCMRRLQYEYFKAPKDKPFTGKALRIFQRGHECENWMAGWFRQAGFTLWTHDANGGQACFRALGGKVLGYADGVFTDGPAECGPYPRLWENKALGAKGWNKLTREGLKKAYPVYYGQVQLYMAYFELADNPALFTALNCDSMEICALDVDFDAAMSQELSDKAVNLVRLVMQASYCRAAHKMNRGLSASFATIISAAGRNSRHA